MHKFKLGIGVNGFGHGHFGLGIQQDMVKIAYSHVGVVTIRTAAPCNHFNYKALAPASHIRFRVYNESLERFTQVRSRKHKNNKERKTFALGWGWAQAKPSNVFAYAPLAMPSSEAAVEIAAKWGPAFTTFGLGGKDGEWEELFADTCAVVMPGDHQQAGIAGATVTVSKSGGEGTLTFDQMQVKMVEQLASVNYAKTEGASKGVQGDEMILEYQRTNKAGEIYHTGYAVLTCNADGLISAMSIFS